LELERVRDSEWHHVNALVLFLSHESDLRLIWTDNVYNKKITRKKHENWQSRIKQKADKFFNMSISFMKRVLLTSEN